MSEKIKNVFIKVRKNWKKLLIFIIGIIVLIVLIILVLNIDSIDKPDNEKFSLEYQELNDKENEDGKKYPEVNIPEDNNFEYVDIGYILDIFNNKQDGVIFFGYPTCIYCRSAIQVLYDTAKDTELEKIYYLDVEKKNNKYDKLIDILGDEFINKDDTIYAPLVLFVAEGKIISYNKGTLISQKDPFDELDYYQKKGLSDIYRYGIRDVLKSINKNKENME